MDIDTLVVVAQLLTGLAKLTVASVLIWQMILQRKSLQIAHSDADNNLSMQATSERNAIRRWFTDKSSPDLLKKLDDGMDALDEYELEIFLSQMRSYWVLVSAEWRLGRVGGNPGYYKAVFKGMLRDGRKAGLEYYKKAGRDFFNATSFGDTASGPTLMEIADEAFEEWTGVEIAGESFGEWTAQPSK